MFYINTRKSAGAVKEKQLLDAMLVPPEERLTRDHQIIYRFFNDHEMLKQLERTKSLNARIKCIAAMLLINRQNLEPEQQILMYVFEDQRAIVLPKSAVAEAQAFNEKIIRRKMDIISTFSMMKLLKYDQLLYLSFNLEEISCKYKDYLYREGQTPDSFYLIMEGQFHYVKDCNENEPKIKINKNKKKVGKLKSIEQDEQSPNKYVKPHINRYRIGIVQGKLGQTIGLEELVLQQYKEARRYSVLCNSTENKCIRIHKKYIQVLFEEFPNFHQQVMNQIRDADNAKLQLFQRIKQTKSSLKQILKKSLSKIQGDHERQQDQQMRSLQKLNEESDSKNKLPFLIKRSSFSIDYKSRDRSRIFSSVLEGNIKSEENRFQSLKSESNLDVDAHGEGRYEDQQGGPFALTGLKAQSIIKPRRSPSYEDQPNETKQITQIKEQSESRVYEHNINFPQIGRKSISNLDGSSINLKNVIKIRQKNKNHQYGEMIDCNKLVEEKESILGRHNNKVTRQDIFPIGHIEYKQPKRTHEDPMKLKASPAHSNRFMEKMLLKVLKRAGYDESAKQSSNPKDHVLNNATVNVKASNADIHKSKSRRRDEIRNHRTAKKQPLLVNSPFDDCYFTKI